jgi:hypothetical protein
MVHDPCHIGICERDAAQGVPAQHLARRGVAVLWIEARGPEHHRELFADASLVFAEWRIPQFVAPQADLV